MKNKKIMLCLLLVSVLLVAVSGLGLHLARRPLVIDLTQTKLIFSEVCSKNESIIADNDGKYRDYIELYNAGQPVSLNGCYLTDGTAKTPLEDVLLQTGEVWLCFLSKEETGFSLGASGGQGIQLMDGAGTVLAQINTSALLEDQVMRWLGGEYEISYEASPGFENETQFRTGQELEAPKIVISEILAKNESALPDEKGVYCDVLELQNVSDETVDLHGWWLSDDAGHRFGYRLPRLILGPGEFLVLYCDGENYVSRDGSIHVNFGLSASDTVTLTDRNGGYTRQDVQYCGEDLSLCLTENGYEPLAASPGYANTEEGILQFQTSRINMEGALVISQVLLSGSGVPYNGSFCDVIEITNRSESTVSTENWYLCDGGDPYAYPLEKRELKSGEKTVIVCGPETTGFSISEGEVLRLTGPDYKHLPPVVCTAQPHQSICLSDSREIAYSFGPVSIGCESEEEFRARQLPGGLWISELMSANNSYLKGHYGETCDWLELYNASGNDIDLSEYHITNNPGNLYKFRLPQQTVKAGEYCVIFLAKDTANLSRNYSSVPFTLASEGEALYISKDGTVVDYVNLPALDTDISYGRPQGEAAFDILEKATPAEANTSAARLCAAPTANIPQGSYDGVEYLDIVLQGEGTIYYTTDCTTPTKYSRQYTGPIRLTETAVLRVMCAAEGKKASRVVDLTYLINEGDGLEAVSIVTDPDNLFSYSTGIYVAGAAPSYFEANYYMDWERQATVSLFETDGSVGFSSPCGIKIFGYGSRIYDKKSLACMFRSRYGADSLSYPLFGQEGLEVYESFVLRAGGQEVFRSRLRDELITSLVGDHTDVPVQKYRPVVLYLNGRYYGIFFLREKVNEQYFAGNYHTEAENVSVSMWNGDDNPQYQALIQYVRTHDLSKQEHYDYVCERVDVAEYIDYMAAQIWAANSDNSNTKFYKLEDGKWRWIFYDLDYGMRNVRYNALQAHWDPEGTAKNQFLSTALINGLLKNQGFREAFLERLAWQINNIWQEDVIFARLDEIVSQVEADMPKECRRWGGSCESWLAELETIRTFCRGRTEQVIAHVQAYFGLTREEMRQYGYPV